ncbi:sigma-70 family RNA polymerase sigma factor [Thermodesulfobacteriota bacterium]
MKDTKRQSDLMEPQKWVDLYGDQLYGYAFARVRNQMVAEDLVQETFLAALAGGDGFEGRSSEKTWLTAILKHKIIDYFRKLVRQPMNQFQDQEEEPDRFFHENGDWKEKPERWDIAPDQILHQKEFWNVFLGCLSELSERLRIAFSLRELEGLGCDEICKVLGVSSSNCWVMLYRARMLLRRCLGVNWFGGKDVSLDV